MKRVATAIVLIPAVVLLVFKASPALVLLSIGCVSYFCVKEFAGIAKAYGLRPFQVLLFSLVLLPYTVPALLSLWAEPRWASPLFLCILLCSPFAFLVPAIWKEDLSETLPNAAVSLFGFLYVGVGLFSVWLLHQWGTYSRLLVFCLLVIVWSGDISAYYAGTYLGRRKLAPRVSPNKTWEGAIASLVSATGLGSAVLLNADSIVAWLGSHHLIFFGEPGPVGWGAHPVCPIWFAVTASAIINIAAQLGDLAESAMKRGANIKDSGTILPGHGGILDRVDALLFAAPVAMLLFFMGPTAPGFVPKP